MPLEATEAQQPIMINSPMFLNLSIHLSTMCYIYFSDIGDMTLGSKIVCLGHKVKELRKGGCPARYQRSGETRKRQALI